MTQRPFFITVFVTGAVAVAVACLGLPRVSGNAGNGAGCRFNLQELALTGVGIDRESRWAILEVSSRGLSEAVFEGESGLNCLTVVSVERDRAVIKDEASGVLSEIFLVGLTGAAGTSKQSGLPPGTVFPPRRSQAARKESTSGSGREEESGGIVNTAAILRTGKFFDGTGRLQAGLVHTDERRRAAFASSIGRHLPNGEQSLDRVMNSATFVDVDPNVTRIRYPRGSDTSGLPREIFWNGAGESLFESPESLGFSDDAEMVRCFGGDQSGIRLGETVRNSVIGGLGFEEGDIIVSIGGRDVKSVGDVGPLFDAAARGERPIEVVYVDHKNPVGYLTTHLMVLPHP